MRAVLLVSVIFFAGIAKADSYEIFSENGKMGIKNDQGQVIIPASFDALGWSDGSFSVIGNVTGYRTQERWGMLNLKKEFITKAEYESLVYAGGDNIIARKKLNPAHTKTGCLSLKGEVKIPFQYDGITIHGLRAIVFTLTQGKYLYGLTDLQNQVLIPVQFKNLYSLGTLRYAVENYKGKIALYTEDGKPVTDFEIDSISNFKYGHAILFENLFQGLIDREGMIKIKPMYRTIERVDETTIRVEAAHEWFFINPKNEIIKSYQADELERLSQKMFRFSLSGKYGLVDVDLNPICPPLYDKLDLVSDNLLAARVGKKIGVINSDNTLVIPLQYDSLYMEESLLRAFRKIEGWSLINLNNQTVSQKNYDWIGAPIENLYPVINNRYWGALGFDGSEIIHCVFDSILQIKEQHIVVKYKNQYGVVNKNEDWVIAPQATPIHIINATVYLQRDSSNQFIKNFKNEIIYFTGNRIEFKEDHILEFLPDGTEKIIDYQGRIVTRNNAPVTIIAERIFPASEGMRGFKRDGKFGFLDDRGRIRIANRYDDIGEFHEGLAAFKLIGKWGFLSATDQIIINPNYDRESHFQNGLAIVSRNNSWGVIDRNVNQILTLQYDSISRLSDGKFRLFLNHKIGLADEKGLILLEPRFDSIEEIENGLVIVSTANKHGVLTISGLNVIPIIYDALYFDHERKQFVALKKSESKEIALKGN